jgi:hypothetical protein
MKQKLGLSGLLVILQGVALAAPIPIPAGGLVYSQDFDNLATTTNNGNSTTPWADDSTIPGWWLYRAGNGTPTGFAGAAYTYRVADGTAGLTVGQFQSMGANGSTERALGNPSTTAQGELSAIAVFQNNSGSIVELSRVKHNVEVLRTNDGANNLETLYVWWRTGNSLAEIQSITTGPTSAGDFAGTSSGPTSHYILGWNRLSQAEISYSNATINLPVNENFPVDIVPTSSIRVAPGQFFAIRYSNINDAGADALIGIDDVELTFSVPSAALSPVITNVVRNNTGTPADPSDDTVDFTLTVTGSGAVSPSGWTLSAPFTLVGQTGTYGVPKTFTGLTVGEFSGAQHTLDVTVQDAANAAISETVVLTAPWCSITPVVSNVVRNSLGTPDTSDDTWSYTVTVNGQYGGAGFNSDNGAIPNPGTYGTAYTVPDIPIGFTTESTTFTDLADPACTATITVSTPTIIGTRNFGTAEPLFSDASGVPANWVVDEFSLTQSMNNGGGAPRKVYRSEILNLTAISEVQFSANLQAVDTSAGFEADDSFVAQLIIDGTTTVNLIANYDTNGNGTMEGGTGAADDEFNAAKVADGSYTSNFPLFAVIPASANSVQLVIAGATNSTNETLRMQSIIFELAGHSIAASLVPTVQFDNKGTVSAADDEFRQGVNITPVSPPVGSTGWTSNSTPASGLYADPNPVLFGPYLQADPARDVVLTDNGVPTVTTTVNIPPPTPAIVTTYVANSLARNDNGTPNPADDTLTADFMVSAPVGGPSFVLETNPGGISANTTALSATPQTITVTMTDVPSSGSAFFIIRDASYPASNDIWEVTPNAVVVSEYVLAKKNLGGGLSNVVTLSGSPLPPEWSNYPSVPAVQMNNGVGAPAKVLTSEVVDLSGVSGPVNFTANLRVTDFTSGFEADDTFLAQLILDGDTVNPVNLVAAYDLDSTGAMNGAELAPAPPVNGFQVFNYPISAVIPDSVNSVQLVITGLNNSDNEMMVFEDALFSIGAPVSDTDGDGQTDASETFAGTDPNNPNDYLRITSLTPGAGSVSITFPSKTGRNYQAEASDQLEGGWTALGPVTAGTGADISVPITPVPVPGENKFFLRIRVVP